MRAIISLVEGQGDEEAVPSLIHKVLSDLNRWDWYAGRPIRVGSLGKLRKELEWYLSGAIGMGNCAARVASFCWTQMTVALSKKLLSSRRRFAHLTYLCLSPSFLLIANTKLGFWRVCPPLLVIMVYPRILCMKVM